MCIHFRLACSAALMLALGTACAFAEGATARSSGQLARVYEGEIEWPCWGERQGIVLVVGPAQMSGATLRASGVELYAINGKYRSIAVSLVIDSAKRQIVLSEAQAEQGGEQEVPPGGGTYEGTTDTTLDVMRSEVSDADSCLPQIWIEAVRPPGAFRAASGEQLRASR